MLLKWDTQSMTRCSRVNLFFIKLTAVSVIYFCGLCDGGPTTIPPTTDFSTTTGTPTTTNNPTSTQDIIDDDTGSGSGIDIRSPWVYGPVAAGGFVILAVGAGLLIAAKKGLLGSSSTTVVKITRNKARPTKVRVAPKSSRPSISITRIKSMTLSLHSITETSL